MADRLAGGGQIGLGTVELAEKLQARGFAAVALNGDIQQSQRERTVQQLKAGKTAVFIVFQTEEAGIGIPISLNGFAQALAQLK